MHDYAVRGQYGPGTIDGKPVPGYREEPNVARDSGTPTYCAIRFMIDNWRWHDVPFYLRSGKRMPRRVSEIAIQFRKPPHLMFPLPEGQVIEPNTLAIRVQPKEGISLRFEVKVPGRRTSRWRRSTWTSAMPRRSASWSTMPTRRCCSIACWARRRSSPGATRSRRRGRWWIPIIDFWANKRPDHFPNYAAGTWGPAVADEFIAREGAKWREP